MEELSRRINEELRELLQRPGLSESERRNLVYDLVLEKDRVVADCFDDWRRSRILERCLFWRLHGLLKPEHLENLSEESQMRLRKLD